MLQTCLRNQSRCDWEVSGCVWFYVLVGKKRAGLWLLKFDVRWPRFASLLMQEKSRPIFSRNYCGAGKLVSVQGTKWKGELWCNLERHSHGWHPLYPRLHLCPILYLFSHTAHLNFHYVHSKSTAKDYLSFFRTEFLSSFSSYGLRMVFPFDLTHTYLNI